MSGYYRYLTDLIDELGLGANVTAFPSLSEAQVREELETAHVFALPSLIENSTNSLAEAMLCGTPCVCSYCGGVPSMVEDGYSAIFCPPGDETLLAAAIRCVFEDPDLAESIGASARLTARARHHEETIVDTMNRIYADIATRKAIG
jgi:glycosyltransferase involved in cell wall biosynthesis